MKRKMPSFPGASERETQMPVNTKSQETVWGRSGTFQHLTHCLHTRSGKKFFTPLIGSIYSDIMHISA